MAERETLAMADPVPTSSRPLSRSVGAETRHWTASPVSFWGLTGLVVLGAGLCLWAASVPGTIFMAWLVGHVLLALAGPLWVALVIIDLRRRARRQWWFFKRSLAVAPVLVCLMFGALLTNLPFHIRWSAERPAFDRLAAQSSKLSDQDDTSTKHVGGALGYDITETRVVSHNVLFYEASGDFPYDAGLAYLPHGVPADLSQFGVSGVDFNHVQGPWYTWYGS
jgi:hypothetical protein